jgi:hypothetical protein
MAFITGIMQLRDLSLPTMSELFWDLEGFQDLERVRPAASIAKVADSVQLYGMRCSSYILFRWLAPQLVQIWRERFSWQ